MSTALVRRVSVLAVLAAVTALAPTVTAVAAPAGASAAPVTSLFHSVAPRRILDTYPSGKAAPKPHAAVALKPTRLPAATSAVVLNVTVRGPRAAGYVTVSPHGRPRPGTSSVNFVAGRTIANAVVVPLGTGGEVDLYNGSAGALDLAVDITGYFAPGSGPAAGSFVGLTPARVLDTRSGLGATTPAAGAGRKVAIAGRGGVPTSGVSAVWLNLTTTGTSAPGYVTAWAGGARPATSSVVFPGRTTVATLTLVPVAADGTISLYNGSTGPTDVLADVAGYLTTSSSAAVTGAVVPVTPKRILDTRSGLGATAPGAQKSVTVVTPGHAGLPADHVGAVVLSLTATRAAKPGYLTPYTPGTTRAVTSALNFPAGATVGNLAVVPVGTGGRIGVLNGSAGQADIVADVVGYVLADPDWTEEVPAFPAAPEQVAYGSVDCWAAAQCITIVRGSSGLTATTNGGTRTTLTPPANSGSSGFGAAVSCPTERCQVFEQRRDANTLLFVLYTRGADGSWTSKIIRSAPTDEDPGYPYRTAYNGFTCAALDECVIVGVDTDLTLFRDSTVELVLHAGTLTYGDFFDGALTAVSCRAVGDCVAVGYDDGDPQTGSAVALHLADGSWTGLGVPDHTPVAEDVSCRVGGDCLAVGSVTEPVAYTIAGTTATVVADPPIGAERVSCSPGVCRAVGVADDRLQAARFVDGAWTTEAVPTPDESDQHGYGAVSCPSDDYCLAGGVPFGLRSVHANGAWTSTSVLDPGGPDGTAVAVSCESGGACVELGRYRNARAGARLFARTRDAAGRWGAVTELPTTSSRPTAAGLSCPTVVTCVAVGTDGADQIALTQSGSTWTRTVLPDVPDAVGAQVHAVSCRASGSCVAVGDAGTVDRPGVDTGRAAAWRSTDGSWTGVRVAPPAGSTRLALTDVSCVATDHCVAIGNVPYAGDGSSTGAAATLDGTTWSAGSVPAGSALRSVSCTAVDACVAVGERGASARLSGGSWTRADIPVTPDGTVDYVAVSCASSSSSLASLSSLSSCVAVSSLAIPLVATYADGTWTPSDLPQPGTDGVDRSASLADVDCRAPGRCLAVGTIGEKGNLPYADALG